ncbi:MAG: S41 family peptidase [Planctomycetota bacterium]
MIPPEPHSPVAPRGLAGAIFVLGLAVGLLAALAIERATRYFLDRDLEMVRAVRNLALEEFVGEVRPAELVDSALAGMLGGLDDYSHYYGPAELAELDRETSGEFLGIGVVFRDGEPGRILFPYPDSPAARAGLRVGDRIRSAQGEALEKLESGELLGMLRRSPDEVRLEVEDLDGSAREVLLDPEVVLDPTVRHARVLDEARGLGYVSIRSFSHRTPEEFDHAIEGLRAQGLRALVLDLRANPGGILDAAVTIANRFVRTGALVATRSRAETRITRADEDEAHLAGMPLVVLIDANSASASEVLAAALQDHGAAALVGEPSYGKGSVQTLKHVDDDRAVVKLTTAYYCSPSLRRIEHIDGDLERSGIAPDLAVPLSRAERDSVYRFLFSYSPPEEALEPLRAWEERADVKLIRELPEDRQLAAARALLGAEGLTLDAELP